MYRNIAVLCATLGLFMGMTPGGVGTAPAEEMNEMWGEAVVKLRAENADRGQLFDEGNYAMFVHWGVYSMLANKVGGKTYYGISEWIMNPRMAGIPVSRYMALAEEFNPVKYDAMAIAQLAKDAGMKYIVVTSKHHDGFAMYQSRCNGFNIADATPFKRDALKELAEACKAVGVGMGLYYSHNQDWTFPGARGGPTKNGKGKPVSFDFYFKNKCRPQVEEITTQYGPLEVVWFDTPGGMPKQYVEELVAIVRKNQPKALVCGRAGHGLGDYQSLGDMDVPVRNVPGMWESVDTTNDSWGYAWYDEHWKTPKEILSRLIACVARGGTYMLNIGPRGDGSVPERAARSLRAAGEWIHRYPRVVYGTDASPWEHALPWGDVTVKGNTLFLAVSSWPDSGALYLPGLETAIKSAVLLNGDKADPVPFKKEQGWVRFGLPARAPEQMVSVLEVELEGPPKADPTWGLDPNMETEIRCDFAQVKGAKLDNHVWSEKFGEWKHVKRVRRWTEGGRATWEVKVLVPGDYSVDLTYSGQGRIVWGVEIEGGDRIQNQQNSSQNYQRFPIGWIHFPEPGTYKVSVSCVDGALAKASLSAIHFTPVNL